MSIRLYPRKFASSTSFEKTTISFEKKYFIKDDKTI